MHDTYIDTDQYRCVCLYFADVARGRVLDVLERCDEKLSVEALFALNDKPYLPPLLHWK